MESSRLDIMPQPDERIKTKFNTFIFEAKGSTIKAGSNSMAGWMGYRIDEMMFKNCSPLTLPQVIRERTPDHHILQQWQIHRTGAMQPNLQHKTRTNGNVFGKMGVERDTRLKHIF